VPVQQGCSVTFYGKCNAKARRTTLGHMFSYEHYYSALNWCNLGRNGHIYLLFIIFFDMARLMQKDRLLVKTIQVACTGFGNRFPCSSEQEFDQ